jgi:hypothetical protein
VFKSQFIKDTKRGEEILWWVPNDCETFAILPSIQKEGRAVRMPSMKVKTRQQYLLETRFRHEHGAHIESIHQAALKKLGDSGYLETCFTDEESQSHLKTMYQHMQQSQDKLAETSIRAKRLRYFRPSPEEIAAGEPPLPQEEVQKKLIIISS